MKLILFGATGLVGQGTLRECLANPAVTAVLSIGRNPAGVQHAKLTEIVRSDLFHYEDIEEKLTGYDTCVFTLGISAARVSAEEYVRLTYDLTLAAAETLARLNPQMTFIYVSGTGTDSSENGPIAWARVKGRTENAILRLPFRGAYMFRPAAIEPSHGETSRTPAYRILITVLRPLLPLLRRLFPSYFVTTEQMAKAMLNVAANGYPRRILENIDIKNAAATAKAQ